MVVFLSLFVSCLVVQSITALDSDIQGLRLISVVFRHGERTPINPYPTDPYKDRKYWPIGFGQLTDKGKERHYELGQWLRNRYSGFLNEQYNTDEIYVRSTDVDRTLMSAESNLAGLYPPVNRHWNKALGWQPIPVHTVPQKDDGLLSSHADCPRFTQLQEDLENSEAFKKIYTENRGLFEYISKNAGQNITNVVELDYVYDTLFIEHNNNFTLPDWAQTVFFNPKFKELRDFSFTIDTFTPELRRLKGGPFLKKVLGDCEQVIGGSLEPAGRKMFMYSAHDTTVAPILHSLDLFDPPIAPNYAATILFELIERENQFYMKISYRNETTRPPYSLVVPGCEHLCPIERFKEIVGPMLPEDWRAECGFPTHNDLEDRVTFIAAMASSIMAFVVLVSLCVLLCQKKESNNVRYQRLSLNNP
jgi:lysosomal acid phosphatase